jgi:hypothetical protein
MSSSTSSYAPQSYVSAAPTVQRGANINFSNSNMSGKIQLGTSRTTSNAANCANLCSITPQCTSYEYDASLTSNNCNLYEGYYNPQIVSIALNKNLKPTDPNYAAYIMNYNYPYDDYSMGMYNQTTGTLTTSNKDPNQTNLSLKECINRCSLDPKCNYINYNNDGSGGCWAKSLLSANNPKLVTGFMYGDQTDTNNYPALQNANYTVSPFINTQTGDAVCAPAPATLNGTYTSNPNGPGCQLTCNTGYTKCGAIGAEKCIKQDSNGVYNDCTLASCNDGYTLCNGSCTKNDPNGTINPQTCALTCNTDKNYVVCNGACVFSDPNAVFNQATCTNTSCNTNFSLCNGKCVGGSNTVVNSDCTTKCNATSTMCNGACVQTDPNGQGAPDPTNNCQIKCNTGYSPCTNNGVTKCYPTVQNGSYDASCSLTCASNNGTTYVPCGGNCLPAVTGGTYALGSDGVTCNLSCNTGFTQCGTGSTAQCMSNDPGGGTYPNGCDNIVCPTGKKACTITTPGANGAPATTTLTCIPDDPNATYTNCTFQNCNAGFTLNSSTNMCTASTSPALTPCTDPTLPFNNNGTCVASCPTGTTSCTNGTIQSCITNDPNGTFDSKCALTCNTGYSLNSAGTQCINTTPTSNNSYLTTLQNLTIGGIAMWQAMLGLAFVIFIIVVLYLVFRKKPQPQTYQYMQSQMPIPEMETQGGNGLRGRSMRTYTGFPRNRIL